MKVILASASPRRRELLQMIGLDVEVHVPEVDESRRNGEDLPAFLERVAVAKGLNVFRRRFHELPVISADTIVLVDDLVLGKPTDRNDARVMLRQLSGRRHQVLTGLALTCRGETSFKISSTDVYFKHLAAAEIEFYLDRADFLDKAGAYAIQDLAAVFIERIEGCFFNVMGFPLNLFYRMAQHLGIALLEKSHE